MTENSKIDAGFDKALALLAKGSLVAVPTETVYGLAADASNDEAVAKIYQVKGRPSFNPLIAHVADLDMARNVGEFDQISLRLAEHFWPGPLTLVVPLKSGAQIADAVTAGLTTIALRQPPGAMARLANALGGPIAAPSANSSGKISPTKAQHVCDDLGEKIELVLDGGNCTVGLESTILKVSGTDVILLREGGVSREEIAAYLEHPVLELAHQTDIEAPGQLLSHYAPELPIRLNSETAMEDEALLAFGPQDHSHRIMRNLSIEGNLEEAARNLFAMMKELDKSGVRGIAVQSVPHHGLGAALNDRLKRAAYGE